MKTDNQIKTESAKGKKVKFFCQDTHAALLTFNKHFIL